MMKWIRLIIVGVFLFTPIGVEATEQITGFEDDDLPVLNEELRKQSSDVLNNKTDIASTTTIAIANTASIDALVDEVGATVQVVNTTYSTYATGGGAVNVPEDDTTPLIAEVFAVTGLDRTITPESTSNKLWVNVHLTGAVTTGSKYALCLFHNQSGSYVCVKSKAFNVNGGGDYFSQSLEAFLDAPAITEFTFRVGIARIGAAGNIYINGNTTAAKFNATMGSSITVVETTV